MASIQQQSDIAIHHTDIVTKSRKAKKHSDSIFDRYVLTLDNSNSSKQGKIVLE